MSKEGNIGKKITLSIISGLGALVSIAILVINILMSLSKFIIIYSTIYCVILTAYFVIMTLYNALKNEMAKVVLLKISKSIKFLILASMSLLLYITLSGTTLGWVSFGLTWVVIIIGSVLEYFIQEK